MSRVLYRVGVAAASLVVLAGCGGSGSDGEATETTVTGPAVTELDVGGLDCSEGSIGTVLITWETQNATKVDIVVDSGDPAGAGASGALTLAIPCDDAEHEITLTPLGDDGPGEPVSEIVEP